MNVIALAFGLGVAGFDVFGAVLVVLLVASKLPKQRIATFVLIVLAGTVTAGVAASLLLGGSAELFAQALHRVPAYVWVGAEGAASVGLLGCSTTRCPKSGSGRCWSNWARTAGFARYPTGSTR